MKIDILRLLQNATCTTASRASQALANSTSHLAVQAASGVLLSGCSKIRSYDARDSNTDTFISLNISLGSGQRDALCADVLDCDNSFSKTHAQAA
jgi:hypothetical protein